MVRQDGCHVNPFVAIKKNWIHFILAAILGAAARAKKELEAWY